MAITDEGGVENLEAACRDYEKLMDMVPDEKQRCAFVSCVTSTFGTRMYVIPTISMAFPMCSK